jgi:hypothetical protein
VLRVLKNLSVCSDLHWGLLTAVPDVTAALQSLRPAAADTGSGEVLAGLSLDDAVTNGVDMLGNIGRHNGNQAKLSSLARAVPSVLELLQVWPSNVRVLESTLRFLDSLFSIPKVRCCSAVRRARCAARTGQCGSVFVSLPAPAYRCFPSTTTLLLGGHWRIARGRGLCIHRVTRSTPWVVCSYFKENAGTALGRRGAASMCSVVCGQSANLGYLARVTIMHHDEFHLYPPSPPPGPLPP